MEVNQSQPANPLDWPLPCDITAGGITIKKGCPLRLVQTRLKVQAEANRLLYERLLECGIVVIAPNISVPASLPKTLRAADKAILALYYYKTQCSGAEPSISVFESMVDEALEDYTSEASSSMIGASTHQQVFDALSLADDLVGPPHERIKKLIEQRGVTKQVDQQGNVGPDQLLKKINDLQKALAFWMPYAPSGDHPLLYRIASDAILIDDFETCEPDAATLGYVILTDGKAPQPLPLDSTNAVQNSMETVKGEVSHARSEVHPEEEMEINPYVGTQAQTETPDSDTFAESISTQTLRGSIRPTDPILSFSVRHPTYLNGRWQPVTKEIADYWRTKPGWEVSGTIPNDTDFLPVNPAKALADLLFAAQERDKGNRIRGFDEAIHNARSALMGPAPYTDASKVRRLVKAVKASLDAGTPEQYQDAADSIREALSSLDPSLL